MTESELIKKTLKEFEAYAREHMDCSYNAATGPWTKGVMTRLCKAGQDAGYYVCVEKKLIKADRGGWLYDMIWIKYCETQLIDVGLVLECEWEIGPEEADRKFDTIEYDFQKLILARADLRCMICWAANRDRAVGNIERLIDQVQGFQKSEIGDNYLFCVWVQDERRFEFRSYPHFPNERG